jgi:hypothetical protein
MKPNPSLIPNPDDQSLALTTAFVGSTNDQQRPLPAVTVAANVSAEVQPNFDAT